MNVTITSKQRVYLLYTAPAYQEVLIKITYASDRQDSHAYPLIQGSTRDHNPYENRTISFPVFFVLLRVLCRQKYYRVYFKEFSEVLIDDETPKFETEDEVSQKFTRLVRTNQLSVQADRFFN